MELGKLKYKINQTKERMNGDGGREEGRKNF